MRRRSPRADGAFWAFLQEFFARGEPYPTWTRENLSGTFSDAAIAAIGEQFAAEGRPHPPACWREPIDVFEGWPDAPCALMRFVPNPAYDDAAEEARQRGWPVQALEGNHFHLLNNPHAVAEAMLTVLAELGVP